MVFACSSLKNINFSLNLGSIVIYCGVAIPGFVILGSGMEHSNILDDLEPGWTVYTALILITIHLLMAFLIILNPLSQDMDKLFNVENSECYFMFLSVSVCQAFCLTSTYFQNALSSVVCFGQL